MDDCAFSHALRADATRDSSPARLALMGSNELLSIFWRSSCSEVSDWARWRRVGARVEGASGM